jgi:hypothetical protein
MNTSQPTYAWAIDCDWLCSNVNSTFNFAIAKALDGSVGNAAVKTDLAFHLLVYCKTRQPNPFSSSCWSPWQRAANNTERNSSSLLSLLICLATLPRLVYLTNVPVTLHSKRNQTNTCHTVSTTRFFDEHSHLGTVTRYLPGHLWWHSHDSCTWLLEVVTDTEFTYVPSLLVKYKPVVETQQKLSTLSKPTLVIPASCVTLTDGRWQVDMLPISAQVASGHVADICTSGKWTCCRYLPKWQVDMLLDICTSGKWTCC